MNREIKFRAWRKWDHRMVYDDICTCFSFMDNGVIDQCSSVAMQFTGLYDKDGREIYEGDIMFVPYNDIGNVVVKFSSGEFTCRGYSLGRCAVIGNIYQNPELLQR